MDGAMHDLSGAWTGVYFYPRDPEVNPHEDWPPTPFTARLEDVSGAVTGTTSEPDLIGDPHGPPVTATLEGVHVGGHLNFTKYPDGRRMSDAIEYDGQVSEDGDSISGRWTIIGDWSGVFRMQRAAAASVEARERVEAVRR